MDITNATRVTGEDINSYTNQNVTVVGTVQDNQLVTKVGPAIQLTGFNVNELEGYTQGKAIEVVGKAGTGHSLQVVWSHVVKGEVDVQVFNETVSLINKHNLLAA